MQTFCASGSQQAAVVFSLKLPFPLYWPPESTKQPAMKSRCFGPVYLYPKSCTAREHSYSVNGVIPCFTHVVPAGSTMYCEDRGDGGAGVPGETLIGLGQFNVVSLLNNGTGCTAHVSV